MGRQTRSTAVDRLPPMRRGYRIAREEDREFARLFTRVRSVIRQEPRAAKGEVVDPPARRTSSECVECVREALLGRGVAGGRGEQTSGLVERARVGEATFVACDAGEEPDGARFERR